MAKSSGMTTTTQQPAGVNRRTLLRTGAHAAWAIPAVQIVTQSPALAATGPAGLTVTGVSNTGWTGPDAAGARFAVTFQVNNVNSQATTGLTVSFTLSGGMTASATAPAGWAVSQSGSTITLTKTGPQLAGNSNTGLVTVTFDPADNFVGNAVTVSISAIPGGNGAAGAGSTTVGAVGVALAVTPGTYAGEFAGNGNNNVMTVPSAFTIENTGYQATSELTVELQVPATFDVPASATATGGWSAGVVNQRTIVFTSNSQLSAKSGGKSFQPTITWANNANMKKQAGTFNLTVKGPGGAASASITR